MSEESPDPELVTDPELRGLLAELIDREPIFHRFDEVPTRETFDDLVAPDFWETGASGRRYSREFVWETLIRRAEESKTGQRAHAGQRAQTGAENWEADDFHLREIADETYLLTYTLMLAGRVTRRVTVWQRFAGRWVVLYHQGTEVSGIGVSGIG